MADPVFFSHVHGKDVLVHTLMVFLNIILDYGYFPGVWSVFVSFTPESKKILNAPIEWPAYQISHRNTLYGVHICEGAFGNVLILFTMYLYIIPFFLIQRILVRTISDHFFWFSKSIRRRVLTALVKQREKEVFYKFVEHGLDVPIDG